MKKIEIKNIKGEVLFTHSSENNTGLKTLEKAVVDGVDLTWADLTGGDFTDAKFRGAKFRGAKLRHADLKGADLRDANLTWAELTGADLRGTDLIGAKYNQRQIDSAFTDETTIF